MPCRRTTRIRSRVHAAPIRSGSLRSLSSTPINRKRPAVHPPILWAGRPVEQTIDHFPQRETRLPFAGGELCQRARLAEPGQIGVGLPARQRLVHQFFRPEIGGEPLTPRGPAGPPPLACLL